MATQEERLAELAGQVERGLKRCLRTLQNLGSTSTNVEDLPAEAARVANELEDSRRALRELTERLGKLYDKAVRAFEDNQVLRLQLETAMDFVEAIASTPDADARADAARSVLRERHNLQPPPVPGGH